MRDTFLTTLKAEQKLAKTKESQANVGYVIDLLERDYGYYELFKDPKVEFRRHIDGLRKAGHVSVDCKVTRKDVWVDSGDLTKRELIKDGDSLSN